jgi:hypothetical protein
MPLLSHARSLAFFLATHWTSRDTAASIQTPTKSLYLVTFTSTRRFFLLGAGPTLLLHRCRQPRTSSYLYNQCIVGVASCALGEGVATGGGVEGVGASVSTSGGVEDVGAGVASWASGVDVVDEVAC